MIATKSSYRSKARKSAEVRTTARRETKPANSTVASSRPAMAKNSAGLKFEPSFHTKSGTPFDHVEWDKRTAEINDDSGTSTFSCLKMALPLSSLISAVRLSHST